MNDIQELYKRYAADVYRFALYLCGNSDIAEDITAETFTRIIIRKNDLITETVKAYLLTVARNIFLEFSRREARYQSEPTEEAGIPLEYSYQQTRQLDNIIKVLLTMNVDDRSALLLRAEGVSYDDISRILQISQTAAKVKIHRLRKKLGQKIK